ncbi:biotin--[acetyl-CoA-carboxylase] ligase [Winogradskyella immobilis]|uniref:Biotin--[acetyl-CoA-carboxylase] ligase n=1 Tax=Winogradskyella immobilis TaxID=2816852 RepID=A0ABS8ENH7_9FLAO|nr:biotin--[acetyl-CoA-carboxylase] ligase [Winogradskyella immobilis]MCC1484665.1 biotin--[acetyl-CoA-carboxylase] ligase [Winogradskyella immobilis]MCG0016757.1 biotin--[acetyl-CoA-carboxylase] ligase [Winogradskyella immobilis]
MHIIKLNAIDSTNAYLKAISVKKVPKDFTVVVAEEQTKGRGQMGAHWQSETSKNLTLSLFKEVSFLKVEQQFYISKVVALAIIKTLEILNIPKLSIKWPNDILSANKKISGVLIENVIKNNKLQGSIVGIGLNINQKFFNNLPKASSLHLLTGVVYNKDEVMSLLLKQLEFYFRKLESLSFKDISEEYESLMFRINKPSTFKALNETQFIGYIKGVSEEGKLQILLEDNIIKAFDLKEVSLEY